MKKLSIGLMIVALSLMAGCSNGVNLSNSAADNTKPIVKVNNDTITQGSFQKIFDAVSKRAFAANQGNPTQTKMMTLIYKDKIINDLIIRDILTQQGQKYNIQISDAELNKAVDDITNKVGGKQKLEAALSMNNVNKEDFLKNVKLDLITKKLVEKVAGTNVSDAEVQSFYNTNKATRFTHPDMVRAQHILISANPSDITAKIKAENQGATTEQINQKVQAALATAQQKAESVLKQVKANPSKFSDIAKANSDDPSSAQKGGDLGFFPKNAMVPEFAKVAFATNPGQISDVVKTQFGYHIIKVIDRKRSGIVPFNEVKPEIKKQLEDMKKMQALQKLIDGAKSTSKIVYLDSQYDPKNIQKELKTYIKANKSAVPGAIPAPQPKK